MFDKTQYKLLIQEYMDKHDVSYTQAKQMITVDQIKEYMEKENVSYIVAALAINNYNISLL